MQPVGDREARNVLPAGVQPLVFTEQQIGHIHHAHQQPPPPQQQGGGATPQVHGAETYLPTQFQLPTAGHPGGAVGQQIVILQQSPYNNVAGQPVLNTPVGLHQPMVGTTGSILPGNQAAAANAPVMLAPAPQSPPGDMGSPKISIGTTQQSQISVPSKPHFTVYGDVAFADGDDTNLIVNYVPEELTDDEFASLFTPFGALRGVRMIKDGSGAARGYGFIRFVDADSTVLALQNMNGFAVRNKRLKVNIARPTGRVVMRQGKVVDLGFIPAARPGAGPTSTADGLAMLSEQREPSRPTRHRRQNRANRASKNAYPAGMESKEQPDHIAQLASSNSDESEA